MASVKVGWGGDEFVAQTLTSSKGLKNLGWDVGGGRNFYKVKLSHMEGGDKQTSSNNMQIIENFSDA